MKKELSLAGLLHLKCYFLAYCVQGLHRLEKHCNMKGSLEKSLTIKSALKGASPANGNLNQYKTIVALSNAVFAAPNKAMPIFF